MVNGFWCHLLAPALRALARGLSRNEGLLPAIKAAGTERNIQIEDRGSVGSLNVE